MDSHTFQENWHHLCRKFPLICAVDLTDASLEEVKESAKSLCVYFDHVILLTKDFTQKDVKIYCEIERIINLTCLRSNDVPGNSLEDKIIHATNGQMILVLSRDSRVESNVRWKIYDKVKEMKSPLTDVIELDSKLQYAREQSSFTIKLRIS